MRNRMANVVAAAIGLASAACGGTVLEDAAFRLDLRGDANANEFLDRGEIGNAYDFSASSPVYAFYGGAGAGNGSTAGYSTAKYGRLPQQVAMPVTNPFYPYTTNTQTCLYFYQDMYTNESDVVYCAHSGVTFANAAVVGDVLTIYARLRWDGATSNPNAVVENGFTGWTSAGLLFYLDSNGKLSVITDSNMVSCNLGVTLGEWADVFMTASNIVVNGASRADVTFYMCKTPTYATAGKEFWPPTISTANLKVNPMRVPAGAPLSLGCYWGNNTAGYSPMTGGPRAFKGALADVMIWRRALTKDEMREVMAGRHGAKWMVGAANGSANEFDDAAPAEVFEPETMPWRRMRKSLTAAHPTLTLKSPLPAVEEAKPMILTVAPILQGTAATCPVRLAVNGNVVGSFDLAIASRRNMTIPKNLWRRDAAGNVTVTLTRTETTGTVLVDALALSGSWQVAPDDGGSNGLKDQRINTDYFFAGDPTESHATASTSVGNNRTNYMFGVWMPAGSAARNGWRFSTRITSALGLASGNVEDMALTLAVNGTVLATRRGLNKNEYFQVDIPEGTLVDGMNWLRFTHAEPVFGTGFAYYFFDFWSMTLVPPPSGTWIMMR